MKWNIFKISTKEFLDWNQGWNSKIFPLIKNVKCETLASQIISIIPEHGQAIRK